MERIKNKSKTKIKKQRTKKGEISIRNKQNGKEARVTLQLNINGVKNPRLAKYGATEQIARDKLAEAILIKYIEIQKEKKFANFAVFSPSCQQELEKFDEYMQKVREYQNSNINITQKQEKNKVEHPLSEYIDKMVKSKKKQSEQVGVRKKRKIKPKTVTYYWNTAKKQVLPYFR